MERRAGTTQGAESTMRIKRLVRGGIAVALGVAAAGAVSVNDLGPDNFQAKH
jgi:hypothetical protein